MSAINAEEEELVARARAAREQSFSPYSNFLVGAAVETEDGKIFTGCNIESSSYSLTVCAERVAIWKALSEGVRRFRRIAVVADTDPLTPPCGACRQIIWDFCRDTTIVLANLRGEAQTLELRDLLPRAFDETFLKNAGGDK